METPQTILFSDIVWGDRNRELYKNIDSLAESIELRGTEVPIILSPLPDGKFLLEDGGRRYRAMETLGVSNLYHASVSNPGRPGFVLKERVSSSEDSLLTELITNLHREAMTWQEELKIIVKAWKVKSREAGLNGERLYYATFGKMLGDYGHGDINAAVNVWEAFEANPERFAKCVSITSAYQLLLDDTQRELRAELVARQALQTLPKVPAQGDGAHALLEGEAPSDEPPSIVVPISNSFRLGNSLDWMESADSEIFDHVICDPDFALDPEFCSPKSDIQNVGFASGVAQKSVADSLYDLHRFLNLAFKVLKSSGYCIFFYDMDHHQTIQGLAKSCGFRVQRWPLIWHKVDFRSNSAPNQNFCKNLEYAMVCAKPGSTLAKVQMSSVFSIPSGTTAKDFNHPFAKPPLLWQKLYDAVALPGQKTLDPFCGSGSSFVAALDLQLEPTGWELTPDHYNNGRLNIQAKYKKLYGDSVIFQ